MTGRLEIILGPMMASKSTELLTRLSKYVALGIKVLYVNSSIDTRSSGDVSTHNPTLKTSDTIVTMKTHLLATIPVKDYDVIGIDEAQFFEDLVKTVSKWVETKHIIVAGLDGDANQKVFGKTLELIPLSDEIVKLTALCKSCFTKGRGKIPAPFTRRLDSNTETVIDAGGADKYEPVCRLCLRDI
jgi:thymidine kinase